MAHFGRVQIVVLFQDEIIAAAKALERAYKCKDEEKGDALINALNACYATLYSPELASGECAVTVMCAHHLRKRGKKSAD